MSKQPESGVGRGWGMKDDRVGVKDVGGKERLVGGSH